MPPKLKDEVKSRLRITVEREIRPRFANLGDRWQAAAARAIGVDQSTLNRVMSGTGGSPDFISKVTEYANTDAVWIYNGKKDPNEVPRARDMPGYPAALALAKTKIATEGRRIEPWALEKAGDFKGTPRLVDVTAELLISVALILMEDPDMAKRHRSENEA